MKQIQGRVKLPSMSNLITKRVTHPHNAGYSTAPSARRSWARDLIGVQEEERRRISQELHDDLGQRLALLEITIHQLEQNCLPANVAEGLKTVRDFVADLDRDIHRICYELYPVVLEKLGLLGALRCLCREFSESSGISVLFEHEEIPRPLPGNISMCLYRVTQEALHNVSKHARAKKVNVSLRETAEGIEIAITDYGVGFDPLSIRARKGLGLTTIGERVLGVGGHFSIRSSPGSGTEVRVMVHPRCQRAVAG
jgi:signal transduction histidine kinase